MLKKTVKYTDIDGVERTEDFYFNLTKAEVVLLQFKYPGGYGEHMQQTIATKDNGKILGLIQELILLAYGERDPITNRFDKPDGAASAFSHSEAYSTIFMDLFSNESLAADFFNGLMPADMVAAARAEAGLTPQATRPAPQDHLPKPVTITDLPAPPELEVHHPKMSVASFQALNQEDAQKFLRDGGQVDTSL